MLFTETFAREWCNNILRVSFNRKVKIDFFYIANFGNRKMALAPDVRPF